MDKNNPYYIYTIVFHSTDSNQTISVSHENDMKESMHLLDPSVRDILPALEFVMNLPRDLYDYYEFLDSESSCANLELLSAEYDASHIIRLIPDFQLKVFLEAAKYHEDLIVISDSCTDDVYTVCKKARENVPIIGVKELNEQLLNKCWKSLRPIDDDGELLKLENIEDTHKFNLLNERKIVLLPGVFLSRRIGRDMKFQEEASKSNCLEYIVANEIFKYKVMLNTILIFDKNYQSCGCAGEAQMQELLKNSNKEALDNSDFSVIITFPGVPKEQIRYGSSKQEINESELRAIRILGTHRAISRNGIVIELEMASSELFSLVAEMEKKCTDGTNNKHVWNLLRKFGKMIGDLLNKYTISIIKKAKDITIFSNIPIGLAILENEELPIQCYKPLSYRPLLPLTIQVQQELKKTPQHYIGKGSGIKILFAECINNDDGNKFVFNESDEVYKRLKCMFGEHELCYCHAYKLEMLIEFIGRHTDADVLYISAHGYYEKKYNKAGIMVGEDFWMAENDMKFPPLVILSACHTGPRGIGAVNIADFIIKNGAIAVLSTFIPVNARRNKMLMLRLFFYINEARNGSTRYETMSELWSGVVATNAIYEIIMESEELQKWIRGKNTYGITRIDELKKRLAGSIDGHNSYSVTVNIIKEMLRQERTDEKFKSILNGDNYFPESFFYQFIGSPENILVYNKTFEDAADLKNI